jgi:lipopolysaccharide heptosyltransferase II
MPERVVVRLPNWLGDTVMAVPAIRALQARWTGARLILAGPWAFLLAGQGLADVLVHYPRSWAGRLRTADTVRSLHGDVAVLLPNSFEAAVAGQYWGTRRLVGFDAGGRSWLLTDAVPVPSPRQHQVDEYLLLVEHLGAVVEERVPRLGVPDWDSAGRRRVRSLIEEAGGAQRSSDRPRIGLHLGAAFGSSKVWPHERVVEFCWALEERGMTAVLLGSPAERMAAEAVANRTPALSLVGRDQADLLTAVLAEMDVLVGGDTGVVHLAAALGTPVVTLFGPTDPALTAPRGPGCVLRHQVPCAPCFYRVCPIDHPCLRSIDPTMVVDQVLSLLGSDTRGR